MQMDIFFGLIFVFLFGFVGAWSRFCLVRAVKLFWLRRELGELVGQGKVVVWAWFVVVFWVWMTGGEVLWSQGYTLMIWSLFGGIVFGLGARLNNGCVFSTVWRLMGGQVKMVLTLCGMVVGLVLYHVLVRDFVPSLERISLDWSMTERDTGILVLLLLLWCGREVLKGIEERGIGESWLVYFSGMRYWGSTMLCGIVVGVLLLSYSVWSYPMVMERFVMGILGLGELDWLDLLMVLLLFLGVGLAMVLRGQWSLEYLPSIVWLYNVVGGLLMGLGMGLAAGDNVHLIHAMVSFSPHGLLVFVMVLLGIWLGLLLVGEDRFVGGGLGMEDRGRGREDGLDVGGVRGGRVGVMRGRRG